MQAHQSRQEHPDDQPQRQARRHYTRLSQDRTGAGVNVEDQEGQCRDLAGRLGYTVSAVYSDNDITAFKGGSRARRRGGYEQLLADLRSGSTDAVIAWHTDRLHRDLPELETYIVACGDGSDGIPTHTVKGGELRLDTSSGRMIARILGAVARQEVEHMIERIEAAKARDRKAGLWNGGPRPFGFRVVELLDGNGQPVMTKKGGARHTLEPDPREASAVRDACAKVLGGYGAMKAGQGLYELARQWNAAGLVTPETRSANPAKQARGGQPWNHVSVRRVLINPVNAGMIVHNDGTVTPNAVWQPIIDEGTWRAVRGILTRPGRRTSPGPKPQHLLTGVLICAVCETRRFRVQCLPGRQPVYTCIGQRRESGTRGHVSCKVSLLDRYAEEFIFRRLKQPDAVSATRKPAADIAELTARMTALRAELDEWARTPGITPSQLSIVSAPKSAEIERIEDQLARAQAEPGLEEFAGDTDPRVIWYGSEAEGIPPLPVARRRAVAAKLLRIRLHPQRHASLIAGPGWRPGSPWPFDDEAVEILPPDAS